MFMRHTLLVVLAGDTSKAKREEGEPRATPIGAHRYHCIVHIPLTRPVLEEERENAAVGVRVVPNVAEEGSNGFGPLKALLEKIPTVYADHKVRSRLPS